MPHFMDTKPHPDFDKYWAEHKSLIHWMAKRIALKLEIDTTSIVNTLVIHMHSILWTYDPTQSKFTTYYCKYALQSVIKYWLRYESESWSVFFKNQSSDKDDILLSEKNYAEHEQDFWLYRIPPDDESDIESIISFFDSANDCWAFMTRACDMTDKQMLELYYREDRTLQEIGDKFGVTRERVRQRVERAKGSVKARLKMVSAFADLFDKSERGDK
jgi:RNA polymerase sigma factor (sigma-70 family)